jgi:hypothetical protein
VSSGGRWENDVVVAMHDAVTYVDGAARVNDVGVVVIRADVMAIEEGEKRIDCLRAGLFGTEVNETHAVSVTVNTRG